MPWWVLHSALFSILFGWWMKRWEIATEVSMNYTAYTYYIMLMAKCRYISLCHPLKLLPSVFCRVPIQVSQVETYICMLLGCDLAIQLLLTSSSSNYDDRLVDHFHHVLIYIYAWTNRLTCFSTCNLPMQLLLCVNNYC